MAISTTRPRANRHRARAWRTRCSTQSPLAACLVLLCATTLAHAAKPADRGDGDAPEAATVEMPPRVVHEPYSEGSRIDADLLHALQALEPTRRIDLDTLIDRPEPRAHGRRDQVGFGQPIPPDLGSLPLSAGRWHELDDGRRVAGLEIRLDGYFGLRLGFEYEGTAEGLRIHFLESADTTGELTWVDVHDPNDSALQPFEETTRVWGPVLRGPVAMMAVELAPLHDIPANGEIHVATASIIDTDPRDPGSSGSSADATDAGDYEIMAGSACLTDAACYFGDEAFANISNAVALIHVTNSDGSTMACTATLLNNASGSPYLLTANHCIDDANLSGFWIDTWWEFRASFCGGAETDSTHKLDGARVVVRQQSRDWALIELANDPPGSRFYAGWRATVPGNGAELGNVNHSDGEEQSGLIGVVAAQDQSITITDGDALNGLLEIDVQSGGGIMPISSGSAFFNGSGQVVAGGLAAGRDEVGCASDGSQYAREVFAAPFSDVYCGARDWLNPDGSPCSSGSGGGGGGGGTPSPVILVLAALLVSWYSGRPGPHARRQV